MELQINSDFVRANTERIVGNAVLSITPPIDGNYWVLRVPLSDTQAIVTFPKFFTFGIGFQEEEDWNTNLPYNQSAECIFDHISHNKGDDKISDADCIAAINLIKETIEQMKQTGEL